VAQGLFTSTSNGLGGALGAVLGGRLYAHGGAATTFRGAAVVLVVLVPAAALCAARLRRGALARAAL
jgi:predicted MFS family arabinose efflux permease